MKSVEVKGKTIEKALKAGLIELGAASLDAVDVKVLKHPGIFSQAVVQMTLIGEIADKLDTTSPEVLMSKIEKRAASAKQHVITSKIPNVQSAKIPNVQPASRPAPAEQRPVSSKPAFAEQKQSAAKPAAPQPQNDKRKDQRFQARQDINKPEIKNNERPVAPQERERLPKATAEELEAAKGVAAKYVETALKLMDISAQLKANVEGDEVNIDIATEATNIIGYRGETLDSLEYLTMLAIGADCRIKVNLDSGGYREKRTASLVELAKRLADKAVRTGRKVDLEPMSSLNRKVIHSALAENDNVITRSEGHEPNRYLVIIPKKGNGGGGNSSGNGSGGGGNRNRNNNRNRRNGKGGGNKANSNSNGNPPKAE